MAAPFNLEDLGKLKSFVEFVSANPAILNLPQLDFFKKLIEQFGGKVPEGTFQMPAGAKCPFGGDVKSESKSAPAAEEPAEEEVPEMEAESEESEVELDMEANNMTVLEPNILYLDEKPPKIVKTKKPTTIKKTTKRPQSKMKSKVKKFTVAQKKRSTKLNTEEMIKNKLILQQQEEDETKMDNNDPDDPLYTEKIEVKCELEEENQNYNFKYEDSENGNGENEVTQNPYNNYEEDYDDEDDDKDQDYKYEEELQERKFENSDEYNEDDEDDDDDEYDQADDDAEDSENEGEDDEDEPLIVLRKRKGRPRKNMPNELDDGKVKVPRKVVCRDLCKQHCVEKFTDKERKDICDYYWHLSKEDRLDFLRKHTRARRLTRMKRVNAVRSRGNNCCYYLKHYVIGGENIIPENSNDLIRVCRKFFEATLCTTNHFIKKANDGTIPQIEKDLQLLHEIKLAKEKYKEQSKEPKQILDPETGNLIIVDPNKKSKPKCDNSSADKSVKKKKPRRKPGDAQPEHFPKPIKCAIRCIHKCHTKFSEEERKQICDFFWSMDYKRRKDFVLANMEIKDIETETTPDFRKTNRTPRSYQTRFYMRSGGMRGENLRVCKDFYAKTLCINRYFIQNAIQYADKTTGYYTGSDKRGVHGAPNKISDERKQTVLDHIESYPFWIPHKKSKTKYLHYSLTIRKMYDAYKEKSEAEKIDYVSSHYYYRMFHAHFNLMFLANPNPRKGGGFLKANPNISHYTGEEAGFWVDFKGNKLDIRTFDPTQTLDNYQRNNPTTSEVSQDSSLASCNQFASGSVAQSLTNVVNPPASFMSVNKTLVNQPASLTVVRPDLNPAVYGNLPPDTLNILRIL